MERMPNSVNPYLDHHSTIPEMPQPLQGVRRATYKLGYKYCSRCQLYYYTDLKRCPNCGCPFRQKPRKRKNTAKEINPPPEILQEAETIKVHVKHRGKEAEER